MKRSLIVWSVVATSAAIGACAKSSPSRPTEGAAAPEPTTSVTDATSGISVTSPQALTPVVGQRYKFSDQPLTLTIKNGVTTGQTPLTYNFQVSSDANFTNIVFSRDGVAEGANGQTSTVMSKLAGDRDYFWRARSVAGSVVGPATVGRAFNVGPEVIIQAPSLVAPANAGTLGGVAQLLVQNASRTGPAGAVSYRFEVSESQSFGSL